MNIFDEIREDVDANFSDWIQIVDDKSPWTAESFYKPGTPSAVNENVTKPHCWRCVTVNHCYFSNQAGKMPAEFSYGSASADADRGLYHPHCHCKKRAIKTPRAENITFELTPNKIGWFFSDKLEWYKAWGFADTAEERANFIARLQRLTAEAYCNGEYEIEKHDRCGFHINVFINISGVNEKSGRRYRAKTCWMVFPNGKLKCNTLIGGKIK